MNTFDTIKAINTRGVHESTEGPTRRFVRSQVVGVPTGHIHAPNAHPGPLDGMPEMKWECHLHYSDGTVTIVR